MGLLGIKLDRHRLRPGDTSTWKMGPDGIVQGDTDVTREKLPGYFAGGDKFTGRDALAGVLAAIGDVFAQRGGMQPMAMQNLMGGRQDIMDRAREAQAAQLARQQGREDFLWKQRNTIPAPNDTERDYNFMTQTVGKDAADGWLRRRGDPLVNMTLPNGQFFSGPQSAIPQALGGEQAPARPVGKLTPLTGGDTGNGVGGFPRYRR